MCVIELEMIMLKKEKTKEDIEFIEKFFNEEGIQPSPKVIAEIGD